MAMMPVDESILSVEDAGTADDGFLTNSRLGVMPVAEIEGPACNDPEERPAHCVS